MQASPAPIIPADDPLAVDLVDAIRRGDVAQLGRLLDDNPDLAHARIAHPRCDDTRSLLHVATDWPAHFPNGAETVRTLIAAGADVNARFRGAHTETPLHWAASSDDVDTLDGDARPAPEDLTNAFWCACHGGQRTSAEYLLERGADIDWVGYDELTAIDAARRSGAHELAEWLHDRGARSAAEIT